MGPVPPSGRFHRSRLPPNLQLSLSVCDGATSMPDSFKITNGIHQKICGLSTHLLPSLPHSLVHFSPDHRAPCKTVRGSCASVGSNNVHFYQTHLDTRWVEGQCSQCRRNEPAVALSYRFPLLGWFQSIGAQAKNGRRPVVLSCGVVKLVPQGCTGRPIGGAGRLADSSRGGISSTLLDPPREVANGGHPYRGPVSAGPQDRQRFLR